MECKLCQGQVKQLYAGFCNTCATGTMVDALLENWASGDLKDFLQDNPENKHVVDKFWSKVERQVNVERVLYKKVYKVIIKEDE